MEIPNADPNVRPRPAFLKALGRDEPPATIVVNDSEFQHVQTYKHDCWAATARYSNGQQEIVCKFNRRQSVGGIPMAWVGRWLARRELGFLQQLQGVDGIPAAYSVSTVSGQVLANAAAHEFIPGLPLRNAQEVAEDFFDQLDRLLDHMHRQGIAYVDLHKSENVLVSETGQPWLVDFQISMRRPRIWGTRWLFRLFVDSDRYHSEKHRRRWRTDDWRIVPLRYPWWIKAHRWVAIPFRTLRRRMLVLMGIRKGNGQAATELAPELGFQRALK